MQIFTDLDTQDEAEMLELAVFLQTLMGELSMPCSLCAHFFFSLREVKVFGSSFFLSCPTEHVPGVQLDTSRSSRHLEVVEDVDDDEGVVQLSSISINGGRQISGDIQDFALPKGNLTPELAEQIVEVYRQGGRVSRATAVPLTNIHLLVEHEFTHLPPPACCS